MVVVVVVVVEVVLVVLVVVVGVIVVVVILVGGSGSSHSTILQYFFYPLKPSGSYLRNNFNDIYDINTFEYEKLRELSVFCWKAVDFNLF